MGAADLDSRKASAVTGVYHLTMRCLSIDQNITLPTPDQNKYVPRPAIGPLHTARSLRRYSSIGYSIRYYWDNKSRFQGRSQNYEK